MYPLQATVLSIIMADFDGSIFEITPGIWSTLFLSLKSKPLKMRICQFARHYDLFLKSLLRSKNQGSLKSNLKERCAHLCWPPGWTTAGAHIPPACAHHFCDGPGGGCSENCCLLVKSHTHPLMWGDYNMYVKGVRAPRRILNLM